MKQIRPLILVLLPLIVGLGLYYVYWRDGADQFAATVAEVTGTRPALSGFPYSIRGDLPEVDLAFGEDARVDIDAGHSEVSRGPFRPELVIAAMRDFQAEAAAGPLAAARVAITAPFARASIRAGDYVERISLVADVAELSGPLAPDGIDARNLQIHFRETPAEGAANQVTGPGQANLRISGLFDLGGDRLLRAVIPATLTGDAPLRSLAGWRDGGTLEIDGGLLLGEDEAPLAGFDATLAALLGGEIALAGTVTTDCPLTIRWLIGGEARPAEEFRRRNPAQFALSGTLANVQLVERETPSGGLVRSREPPCPDLRR